MRNKRPHFYQRVVVNWEGIFLIKIFICCECPSLSLIDAERSRYQKEATNFQLERRFRENADDQLVALA